MSEKEFKNEIETDIEERKKLLAEFESVKKRAIAFGYMVSISKRLDAIQRNSIISTIPKDKPLKRAYGKLPELLKEAIENQTGQFTLQALIDFVKSNNPELSISLGSVYRIVKQHIKDGIIIRITKGSRQKGVSLYERR